VTSAIGELQEKRSMFGGKQQQRWTMVSSGDGIGSSGRRWRSTAAGYNIDGSGNGGGDKHHTMAASVTMATIYGQ
jgi:hypothetical protein